MEKVDPSAVRPHVEPLLRSLLLCFKDLGWPVRDAACGALGRCARVHCSGPALAGSPGFRPGALLLQQSPYSTHQKLN
jgi:hypothetical protein